MIIYTMNRACLGLFFGLTLSACGTQEKSPLALMTSQYASRVLGGGAPQDEMTMEQLRAILTPEVVDQFGGSVLLVETVDKGTAAGFLPVAVNGSAITWMTQDGQASVSTQNGALIATRGFGFDLLSAEAPPAFKHGDMPSSQTRQFQHLDGENQVVTTRYTCDYSRGGSSIQEHCHTVEHDFINTYKATKTGKVLHSRQWISPQIGYVVLEAVN
ncbi:YjbF family lipoprotein [Celeribacter halophilus]|uniref:YjbF family lipoprotein n=1 Tax=Celeribacter halophilus TaxID=576117 RepID=UPI003A8CC3C1